MKNQFAKYVAILLSLICIILLGILIYVKSVNANSKSNEKDLSTKITEEMAYLDTNIIETFNKLNNITVIRYKVYTKNINQEESQSTSSSGDTTESSSKDSGNALSDSNTSSSGGGSQNSGKASNAQGSSSSQGGQSGNNSASVSQSGQLSSLTQSNSEQPNWNNIAYLYENIYSTWPTINLDLREAGVNNDLINAFGIDMDGLAQSIKSKDKNSCLINLYNLYSHIPQYINFASQNQDEIDLYNTKLAILNAYVLVSTDKWKDVPSSLSSAIQSFSVIVDSKDDNDPQKKNYEKVKVMLEDIERSSKINDNDVFFMEYKNVMQELENI